MIVDYLGLFDHVAEALNFDEEHIDKVISNVEELKAHFPTALEKALSYFLGVDRTQDGYLGMMAAHAKLPHQDTKTPRHQDTMDAFGADYRVLSRLWVALSPDLILWPHKADYKWLTSVYESVKPVDLTGRLVWNKLGAKTLELLDEHVTVEVPRLDLDTNILDEGLSVDLVGGDPGAQAKEVEKLITARIARHLDDPKFVALSKRLEDLREKYAQGQQDSIDFLRGLLEVARETVATEKQVKERSPEERAKEALTELFEAVRDEETPVMANGSSEIDEIVRTVRYDGWQARGEQGAGEKEVRRAVRRVLYVQYKLRDEDVFEKEVGYIREYY